MIEVEVENRSGVEVDADGAVDLARHALAQAGVDAAELGIAFVEFGHEDVVRHKLVQRIVEAYKLHADSTGTQRSR